MTTFIAAYTLVWLGMALYVVRLRNTQRRLEELAQTLTIPVKITAPDGED